MNQVEKMQAHRQRADAEYTAWLDVMVQLKERGAGEINTGGKDERLYDAIALWGEELAQLRIADTSPTHATNALSSVREAWARWTS